MKYWHRMIKDWLMVWVLMYAIDIIMGLKEASFVSFLYYLIFPTYHLWYIPALFLYVSFFWVMKHYDINDHVILGTAIVFSMVYGLIGEYIIAPVSHDVQYSIGWGIYYSLKPHYGGFFILGWYLRKHILDKKHQIMKFVNFVLWIAFGVLLVARINRSLDFKAFYSFDFYILNYAAIILFFPIIRHVVLHKNLIINEFLQMISDYSLYIYLYHGILVYVRYI